MQAQTREHAVDVTDALHTVAVNSSYNASRALSKWFKRGVRLRANGFERVPIEEAADFVGVPEDVVAAIHMQLQGEICGDVLLLIPEAVALSLADVLMGAPDGTASEFGEIEQSCLQETGNIVGTAFANCLAQWLKLSVIPASPTFIHDMSCAIIEPLLLRDAEVGDDALIAKTEFEFDGQRMDWSMLLLLSTESLELVKRQCRDESLKENALHAIAVNGAFKASNALSKWLKKGVCLSTDGFVRTSLDNAVARFADDEPVVGMYMELQGELHGGQLLMMSTETAREFVELLTGERQDPEGELDEMARSCLQETANIVGTAFANSLAKWLELQTVPSSPQIRTDLASAIFQSMLIDQAAVSDEILMTGATFTLDGRELACEFCLVPTPASYRLIETACS